MKPVEIMVIKSQLGYPLIEMMDEQERLFQLKEV